MQVPRFFLVLPPNPPFPHPKDKKPQKRIENLQEKWYNVNQSVLFAFAGERDASLQKRKTALRECERNRKMQPEEKKKRE